MSSRAEIIPVEQGLHINGDLVYATVSDLVNSSNAMLQQFEGTTINIDCSNLSRLDSAGIALLLEWKRWSLKNNKTFRMVGVKEKATSLISTYKLADILGLK